MFWGGGQAKNSSHHAQNGLIDTKKRNPEESVEEKDGESHRGKEPKQTQHFKTHTQREREREFRWEVIDMKRELDLDPHYI